MILPIYVYGQPVLREEAKDITPEICLRRWIVPTG